MYVCMYVYIYVYIYIYRERERERERERVCVRDVYIFQNWGVINHSFILL